MRAAPRGSADVNDNNLTVGGPTGAPPWGTAAPDGDLNDSSDLVPRFIRGGERAGGETVSYNEAVIRLFVIATMFWGVIGFTAGIFIALELAFPALNLGLEWTSFGRLRPLHTSAVVFAFGGNALSPRRCTSFSAPAAPPFGADRWWPISCSGATRYSSCWRRRYVLGITQGKEYAEPEWYVDLWLTVVWVVYLLTFVGTIMQRREPHLCGNWFYLAMIVTIAMLHLVNNLPFRLLLRHDQLFVLRRCPGALVQWWYGHNAVGFFRPPASWA